MSKPLPMDSRSGEDRREGGRSPDRLESELEALEGKSRELSACLKAMTLVGSSLHLDEVLSRAILSAQELMEAEAASILLKDDQTGELYFKQASGEASAAVKEIRIPKGQGIAGHVAESGESVVIEDAQNDPRFFKGADKQTGFITRSILAVPLRVSGRIIGVAEAINKKGDSFHAVDLPLFTAYAALVAVAIDNARLHEVLLAQELMARELEIARQIQQGLLGPAAGASGECHFYGSSTPARSVGGDFFDWRKLPDGRYMAAIGDVSGKGVPAALFMANVVSLLRSESVRLAEPHEILASLNDTIAATSQRGMFVSLFLAFVTESGEVTYATAGHPMPIFLSSEGFKNLPRQKSPPVGILAGTLYESARVTLGEGEVLVAFTDGVTEAKSPKGEFFEYERLKEAICRWGGTPSLIPERLRQCVIEFEAGAERSDDLTIAVISRRHQVPGFELAFDHLSVDDLAGIRSRLEDFLAERQVPSKLRTSLMLSLDEACTNVIRHAYGGEGGPARVVCRMVENELQFELHDRGCGSVPSFPAGERKELKPGGLGLVILQKVMDEVRFEPTGDCGCVLRMKKRLDERPKST